MIFLCIPSIFFVKLFPVDLLSFIIGTLFTVFSTFFLNSLWCSTKKLIRFLKIDKEIQAERNNLHAFLKEKNMSLKTLIDDLDQKNDIRPYRKGIGKSYSLNIEEIPSTSMKYSNPIQKKRKLSNELLKKFKDQFSYNNKKMINNKVSPWI